MIGIFAIEGRDGIGKTTALQGIKEELKERLRDMNVDIEFLKFPDESNNYGKIIRKLLVSGIEHDEEFDSYMQHLNIKCREETISKYNSKKRDRPILLVCDRFTLSRYLYCDRYKFENMMCSFELDIDREEICHLKDYFEDYSKYITKTLLLNIPISLTEDELKNRVDNDVYETVERQMDIQERIERLKCIGNKNTIFHMNTEVMDIYYGGLNSRYSEKEVQNHILNNIISFVKRSMLNGKDKYDENGYAIMG